MSVPVLSMSQPVWERLQHGPLRATVLAVFREAYDLVTADGYVVALVLPQVGNGPLNAVVATNSEALARGEVGMPARLDGAQLRVGELVFTLESARIWDPQPHWKLLRSAQAAHATRWANLRNVAVQLAPTGSLLDLVAQGARSDAWRGTMASSSGSGDSVLAAMREGTIHLRSGWSGNVDELRRAAAQLAGLGSGLTPAGDDFLVGVMLWAWLVHPDPEPLCSHIVEVAAPRTTLLSAAFLRAAARGECNEAWHALLAALARDSDEPIAEAVREVLSHGATSGADALAGFLWAADRAAL